MHGLDPHEEIAYWRERHDRLAAKLADVEKERDEWIKTAESWRHAFLRWQSWGAEMRALVGCDLNGDEPTRAAIADAVAETKRQRDEYKRLYFDAIDERDRMAGVYDAAVAWRRPVCAAGGWGCDGCERCDAATETLIRTIDAALTAASKGTK